MAHSTVTSETAYRISTSEKWTSDEPLKALSPQSTQLVLHYWIKFGRAEPIPASFVLPDVPKSGFMIARFPFLAPTNAAGPVG